MCILFLHTRDENQWNTWMKWTFSIISNNIFCKFTRTPFFLGIPSQKSLWFVTTARKVIVCSLCESRPCIFFGIFHCVSIYVFHCFIPLLFSFVFAFGKLQRKPKLLCFSSFEILDFETWKHGFRSLRILKHETNVTYNYFVRGCPKTGSALFSTPFF